jgi:hypothetical protein
MKKASDSAGFGRKAMTLIAAVALFGATTASAGLYDPWKYQAQIQFTGYNKTETLINFPALVVLSAANISGFDYSQFLSGSNADLRFTDSSGTVTLNYEIESWNPGGDSYVWVQVPAIADASAAIVACWGASGQTAPVCTTNGATWSNGYAGVWHLPTINGIVSALNSTSNSCNGINNGATAASGLVAGAGFFGGSNYINLQHPPIFNIGTGDFTVEAYIKGTGDNSGNSLYVVLGKLPDWQPNDWMFFIQGSLTFYNIQITANSGSGLMDGTWHHVAATRSAGTLTAFADAIAGASVADGNNLSNAGNCAIGSNPDMMMWNNFPGTIDEVRFSNVARSANWIWACRMNTMSNTPAFQTYGAATAQSSDHPPTIVNLAPTNILSGAAFLNGQILSTGSAPVTAVCVYWGNANGGTNAALWANTNIFASEVWNMNDVLTTNITTLSSGQDYFYTYSAANANGAAVAAPSRYLITGDLNVYAVDPLFASNALDTATFVVTRPDTCTVGDLPFNYTLSGTATNNVDYTISWSSGGPTIPAGQTNATLTVTPIINANNFGSTRSLVVTLNPGTYALGTASANGTFQSFPMYFTWNNAAPGTLSPPTLDPANWIPAGQFLNIFGVICDVNAGGVADGGYWSTPNVHFNPQLNVYSNAAASGGDSTTFASLHLRGGTMYTGGGGIFYGHCYVDNNSVLDLSVASWHTSVAAEFSGSGNLCVSNNGTGTPGTYDGISPFTANNTNYSGVWSFYGTWIGNIVFSGDMGIGGLKFGPVSSNIWINVNTTCPWTLDLQGGRVYTGYPGWPYLGVANPEHTGTFTLLSDSIISANGQGNNVLATINGRITGAGRLITWAYSWQNPASSNAIKLGGTSDYTGGTVVMTNILEAATAGSLGTGSVEVQPGAKLQVDVSATMNPQAKLYLDGNGMMDLGAGSVTTTVSRAFIGGTGGWQAPSGYTDLAPGTYTKDSPGLDAYLVNNGVLKVQSSAGLTVFIQ